MARPVEANPPSVYFHFWWPLALTGWLALLVQQVQNGVVARWQDAAGELAVFAIAGSLFSMFGDLLAFLSQTSNALGRNRDSRRSVLRFTLALCGALSLPVCFMAFSPGGDRLVRLLFRVDDAMLAAVRSCLAWLSPLVLLNGFREYAIGLLLQARRTRTITTVNLAAAASSLAALFIGLRLGYRPALVLAASLSISTALQACIFWILARRLRGRFAREGTKARPWGEIFAFFWPTALTSLIFSLSRPVIFSFASRAPDPVITIAALRIAFDFAILFQNPLNQVRHLFITFGFKGLAGVRRFVIRLTFVSIGAFALVAFTPLGDFLMAHLLGSRGEMTRRALEAIRPLVPIPIFITVRNYYHGLAMLHRKTLAMAVGSLGRFTAIYLSASLFFMAGGLGHVSGAACLMFGFFAEMLLVLVFARGMGTGERGERLPQE
ncbi:MAG: hypothetical protein J0L75_03285 [Spirochaetes bacterium]|nr:hypothetical protein [Spirochaetota bacterium]